jgi:hypothetical protein
MTTCTLCGLEPMECEHAPVEFFGEPTAPPPTLEDEARVFWERYWRVSNPEATYEKMPSRIAEFARQRESAARAEADAEIKKLKTILAAIYINGEKWVVDGNLRDYHTWCRKYNLAEALYVEWKEAIGDPVPAEMCEECDHEPHGEICRVFIHGFRCQCPGYRPKGQQEKQDAD